MFPVIISVVAAGKTLIVIQCNDNVVNLVDLQTTLDPLDGLSITGDT